MNEGSLLKYYRKKREWSQEEVSKEIVSTSYYSKIENGLIKPAPETLNLLFERLGIERSKREKEKSEFKLLLQTWEEPLLFNQKKEAASIKENLESMLETILEVELLLEFQVKNIRFLIIMGNLDEIPNSEVVLAGLTDNFNRRTAFFYYKHLGNFYYVQGDLAKANESFKTAISLYTSVLFSELEKADLHYLYSLVLSRLRNDYNSLNFAESSLAIFREHYCLESCAKAHIQIGIGYSRLQNTNEAMKHYETAKELIENVNNFKLLGIIEHNIASLYFRQNNINAAIDHLENSLYYKKKYNDTSYFATLILLITYNYARGDLKSCDKWIKKGISLLNKDRVSKVQELEIEFYKKFLFEKDADWESFCTKYFFTYLKENKKWSHLITYSKIIGNYFNEERLYKKSATYFHEVINAYEEIYKH